MNRHYFTRIIKYYLLHPVHSAGISSDTYSEIDGALDSLDELLTMLIDQNRALTARIDALEAAND